MCLGKLVCRAIWMLLLQGAAIAGEDCRYQPVPFADGTGVKTETPAFQCSMSLPTRTDCMNRTIEQNHSKGRRKVVAVLTG